MADPIDLKIFAGGINWIGISGKISLGLSNYYSPLPDGSTVSVVSMDPGRACIEGVYRVADGRAHASITTPDWFLRLAVEGKAPFGRPMPLRMLTMFPHDDRMAFAIRRELGIRTFRDLIERRYPLKVSALPRTTWHPTLWGAETILAEYGISFDEIVSWGGEILGDRPRFINSPDAKVAAEGFEAVFDEAMMTRRWKRITDENDMVFLPLDPEVIESLEAQGWRTNKIEKGRFRGIDEDVPAADFSNWALYCNENLDDEIAYQIMAAVDEQKKEIEALFPAPFAAMTGEIDFGWAARTSPIPLHPGAERYCKDKGYL